MPEGLLVYLSIYVLVLLPIFLVKDDKTFQTGIKAMYFTMGIAFLFYFFIPSEIIRPTVNGNNFFEQMYLLQTKLDAPYNLLPSLHVAFSLLVAFILYHENKKYWWAILWATLISISALFVKQHYLLDIFTGIFLGYIVYRAVFLQEIKNSNKSF